MIVVILVLGFLGYGALRSMPQLSEWATVPAPKAQAFSEARAAWWRDCLQLIVLVVTPVLGLLTAFASFLLGRIAGSDDDL